MRILVVEDDKGIAECIQKYLESETLNFICDIECNYGNIIHKLQNTDYDLILLDLNLPEVNGFSILEYMRDNKISIPVIVITGQSELDNKMKAFAIGADDYILKPFSIQELKARIKAVKRRCLGFSDNDISCGDMVLNQTTGKITLSAHEMELSNKEFAAMQLLLLHQNRLVRKETFLDHLYKTISDEPSQKIIDVLICKLRKKIYNLVANNQNIKACPTIKTVWGRGYILEYNADESRQLNVIHS